MTRLRSRASSTCSRYPSRGRPFSSGSVSPASRCAAEADSGAPALSSDRIFTAIAFSPWSEKARWALDHHRVAYRERDYTPVVGEYRLRVSMRRPFGRLTVPVLRDGGRWLTDSFDIARHAETIGCGPALFPVGTEAEIAAWNARSEVALAAGRAILMQGWARSPELAIAAVPAGLPAFVRPLLLRLGRRRLASFMAKYAIHEDDSSVLGQLAAELDGLRRALGGRLHLVADAFSYADIAMALTLQQVKPVDPRWIVRMEGLGPSGMNVPELERRYADLVEWRDELYAKFRRPGAVGAQTQGPRAQDAAPLRRETVTRGKA